MTANGTVERSIYSEVKFTVLGRSGTLEVTNLPDGAPVLVGHMVMELLDLAVDMQRGLIYNPAHDGKWIEKQLWAERSRRTSRCTASGAGQAGACNRQARVSAGWR